MREAHDLNEPRGYVIMYVRSLDRQVFVQSLMSSGEEAPVALLSHIAHTDPLQTCDL